MSRLGRRIVSSDETAPVAPTLPAVGTDHGTGLVGLSDDDHTQYVLLLGRPTGQTVIGGTATGDDLVLQSTSHATKGNVDVGESGGVVRILAPVGANLTFTDATYDIGASGATRPRDIFLSRNLNVAGTLTVTGNVVSNLTFTDATYDIGASGATRPRDLYLSGAVKGGAWQGTAVDEQYGGIGGDFSSQAQGGTLHFSATGVISALGPGTSGQFLKTQGASANPVWSALTPDFTSAQTGLDNDAQVDIAHSLGAAPSFIRVTLVCTTDDLGYVASTGDAVEWAAAMEATDRGATVFSDATNVSIVQGAGIALFSASSFNIESITDSSWRWVVRAWK